MKRFAFAMAASIALAACGGAATGSPSPAAATATTAAATPATTFVFTADLKSSEEVPPITGAEATCSGKGTLTLNTTAKTAKFDVQITGCPATAVINIGHIHQGAKGVAGPVKIDSTLKPGELTLAAGAVTFSKTNPAADAAIMADVIANPAGWYMNWHTTVNAGGVIRGQLVKG